jgi:hypothetical protein
MRRLASQRCTFRNCGSNEDVKYADILIFGEDLLEFLVAEEVDDGIGD